MNYKSITIEFNQSTSYRFKFALQEAKKHKSFSQVDNIYSVTFTHRKADLSYQLAEYLRGIRNKRVYVDGQELPWDEVFHYCNCYALRKAAFDPVQFCMGDSRQFPAFNLWRCIQAMMPLSDYMEWLCYGHFDLDGTFIFDKEKIRHYLITNTHKFRFCPAMRIDIMLKVLEAFPETINPKIDQNWKYAQPISRELKVGVSTSSENKAYSGVAPSSPAAVKNIYRKILEKFC